MWPADMKLPQPIIPILIGGMTKPSCRIRKSFPAPIDRIVLRPSIAVRDFLVMGATYLRVIINLRRCLSLKSY